MANHYLFASERRIAELEATLQQAEADNRRLTEERDEAEQRVANIQDDAEAELKEEHVRYDALLQVARELESKISFLTSVIACGEQLNAEDKADIRATLTKLAALARLHELVSE